MVKNFQVFELFLHEIEILVIGVAAFLALKVSREQNKISERALNLQNFVEVFFTPQIKKIETHIINESGQTVNKTEEIKWVILIKNASSQPIYLNRYYLNEEEYEVGNSVIPTGSDNWYFVNIPDRIQQNEKLSLEVWFEDYLKNKYKGGCLGSFVNYEWQIKSEKSKKL